MPNPKIPVHQPASQAMYVSSANADSKTQEQISSAYSNLEPIIRSSGSYSREMQVRHGMDRGDYEVFRPGESLPRIRSEVLQACLSSYKHVSPIRNIFDMMTDFTTQGIRLVHPNPSGQQLYNNWAKKIGFYDRSQHFVNNYYLLATAIVTRKYSKLNPRHLDDLYKGIAKAAIDGDGDLFDTNLDKPSKNVIPSGYDFKYPGSVDIIGGELARFAGKTVYALQIPQTIISRLRNPITDEDKYLVSTLPEYVRKAIAEGKTFVPLDKTRVSVFNYKKQDWDDWADPILLSVMDDIVLLQKMKLTDLAALDGAISHIRIWKLGSLEKELMPTQAAFAKLDKVLRHAGNGQSFDLIWGPDLTLEEKTSDVYKYLGQEKYAPVLSSIFSGLGVPPTLVGGGGGEKGFTNNSLSLKTLIERLNYGRKALVDFWENEVKLFQQALRLRFPAKLEFKHAVLTDEAAYNSLLIDMLDRDIISVSVMREHLGYIPEIQDAVVRAEYRARSTGKMAQKAGQFHNPEQKFDLTKIFVQGGGVTPSEVGIELQHRKKGEKDTFDRQMQLKPLTPPPSVINTPKKTGRQYEGRPPGSKDTTTRKVKRVVPRTGAGEAAESLFVNLTFWTKEVQEAISKIVSPGYLNSCGKQNLRQLTNEEIETFEHLKFSILCNLDPFQEINESVITSLVSKPLQAHAEAEDYWKTLVYTFMQRNGRKPIIDEIRQIQCYVYALYKGDYEVEEDVIGDDE